MGGWGWGGGVAYIGARGRDKSGIKIPFGTTR